MKEFKKLLIDLDLTQAELGRRANLSKPAIHYYLSGAITNPLGRKRIRAVLLRQAKKKGVDLPEFWTDSVAAA